MLLCFMKKTNLWCLRVLGVDTSTWWTSPKRKQAQWHVSSPRLHLGGFGIEESLTLEWATLRKHTREECSSAWRMWHLTRTSFVVHIKPESKLPFITLSRQCYPHMDLFGPTSYKSIGDNLYCLVIIDDYSCYTWTLFLCDKSETPEIFKTFARRAQREYNSPIVKIQSDNSFKFKNMNEDWCGKESVKYEFSATYTP
jgi:hypothetical protein